MTEVFLHALTVGVVLCVVYLIVQVKETWMGMDDDDSE